MRKSSIRRRFSSVADAYIDMFADLGIQEYITKKLIYTPKGR